MYDAPPRLINCDCGPGSLDSWCGRTARQHGIVSSHYADESRHFLNVLTCAMVVRSEHKPSGCPINFKRLLRSRSQVWLIDDEDRTADLPAMAFLTQLKLKF